jgi:hypothetical protein
MSASADLVRELRTRGVNAEILLDAVLAAEEERLAKGRARAAKYRNNKRHRHVSHVTNVTPPSPETKAPTPLKTQPLSPKENPPYGGQKKTPEPTCRSELEAVLDPEHAAAVLDHRQRIRRPLTPHAAKLLAGKFAQCPEPNRAADEMIAQGWQGFDPQWLNGSSRGPPSSRYELDPLGNRKRVS